MIFPVWTGSLVNAQSPEDMLEFYLMFCIQKIKVGTSFPDLVNRMALVRECVTKKGLGANAELRAFPRIHHTGNTGNKVVPLLNVILRCSPGFKLKHHVFGTFVVCNYTYNVTQTAHIVETRACQDSISKHFNGQYVSIPTLTLVHAKSTVLT